MKDKVIPLGEALNRAAEKAGIAVSSSRIETVDDHRVLPYQLGKVGHLARWIVSLEHVDTPNGRRLFVLHQVPQGDDGVRWIGIPVDAQPPEQRLMTEAELAEVARLVEAIYRRGK